MKKRVWVIVLSVLLMIGGFIYYFVSPSEISFEETDSKEKSNIKKENIEEEESMMNDEFVSKINLVIQGEEFTATLEDNETSRAFVNQLPLTMTMNELNGNEKYYYLDKNLPSQATSVSQIETGDLMLYGDDCLVLFYDTFKTSYRYTRIGKLDQIIQLKELVGNGTIEVSISELCKKDIRKAKKLLAFEVTKLVHGEEEAIKAKETAEELFGDKGISENMPSITISKELLDIKIIDLLTEINLVSSKSEARRLIEQNGLSLNQEKVKSIDQLITNKSLQENYVILQKGKKTFLKIIFE